MERSVNQRNRIKHGIGASFHLTILVAFLVFSLLIHESCLGWGWARAFCTFRKQVASLSHFLNCSCTLVVVDRRLLSFRASLARTAPNRLI